LCYRINVTKFEIESYVTEDGETPFLAWLLRLNDKKIQAKLYARLDRASFGNFGDWKALSGTKGIYEMREHFGQGYRIYYAIVGKKVILLLAGSTKKDQNKVIAKAKKYLADYKNRKSK